MMVDFPPGVVSERSRRSNQVNWRETNLVRWDGNTMLPVGGWEKVNYPVGGFLSPVRAMHRWNDNAGTQFTAFLCEQHCYVDNGDGVLVDITPVDGIAPPPGIGDGGWGDEKYNVGDYGTPRDAIDRLNVATPSYTLDNWGQELRAMTSSDGRLLGWDPTVVGAKLEAVENAPTGNRSFAVTPERIIILFSAGGVPQQFLWSDQENDTNWTPSTVSKSGGYYIEPSAPIMAGQLTAAGTLMFTARLAYIIRYIGLPYVYSYEKVSECPPPLSPSAIVEIPAGAFWAALNGFWIYNGVNAEPVPCPLWDWIKANMDVTTSRFKAAMVNVAPKFEVWFFFANGDTADNSHVVIYNYRDKRWSMGRLGRSCGLSTPNDPNPLMSDGTKVYKHEMGYQYPGAQLPWAETYTMNTQRGGSLTTIRQMLPEILGSRNAVQFKFIKRNDPTNGPEVISLPKKIRSNGYVDVRETARDIRMRVEMINGSDWSMGPVDFDLVGRGKK